MSHMTSITHQTAASYDHNALTAQQYFVGNPLDRSCLTGNRKDPNLLSTVLADGRTKCLICSQQFNTSKIVLCGKYCSSSPLLQLAFLTIDESLQVAGCMSSSDLVLFSEVVLLGRDEESDCWVISIDVSSNITSNEDILSTVAGFSEKEEAIFSFCDARSLLQQAFQQCFSQAEVALAGQVFAISGWHATNRFMGSTGQPTAPVECGMKRSVSTTARDKIYPRIDPVAICLVISPDGESVLLGHMKRSQPGFFSCLSGFVEQCESVQEAVCREVREESGVLVSVEAVRLVDSQPWPLGRGGGCELMLGCIAQASSTEIIIHDPDVEEVRWFSREQVRQLVANQQQYQQKQKQQQQVSSAGATTNYNNNDDVQEEDKSKGKAQVPGEYAIAYHLMKSFVNEGDKGGEGEGDEKTSSPSIIMSPTNPPRLSLFLIPMLMFLINSKKCLLQ